MLISKTYEEIKTAFDDFKDTTVMKNDDANVWCSYWCERQGNDKDVIWRVTGDKWSAI